MVVIPHMPHSVLVMVTVVTLCVVSCALSSCHTWSCVCSRHATHGLVCTLAMPHVVSCVLLSCCVWSRVRSCCAARGLMCAVIVLCVASCALSSCCVWLYVRCCHAARGLACTVVTPHVVSCALLSCRICVAVSIIVLCMVLWALSSCHIWCCSCCHCTTGVMVAVGVVEPHGVAVTFIAWSQWVLSCRAVSQSRLWCCMVLQSRPLHHVMSLNCEDRSDWTAKDEVSGKK
jgi:hypothetical protein